MPCPMQEVENKKRAHARQIVQFESIILQTIKQAVGYLCSLRYRHAPLSIAAKKWSAQAAARLVERLRQPVSRQRSCCS